MRFSVLAIPFISTLLFQASGSPIEKRQTGHGTFFHPGLGACGGHNGNNDLITAIGIHLFQSAKDGGDSNNNPFCGRKIKVTHGKKSVEVTVVDACEACGNNDLDLSPAAFSRLAAESLGVIPIQWEFLN